MKNKIVIEKIISVMLAFIVYFCLCYNNDMNSYSMASWFVFAMLIIAFLKTNLFAKEHLKERILLTILFSFITVYGNVLYMSAYHNVDIIKEVLRLGTIKNILLYTPIIYIILTNIYLYLYNLNIKESKKINISNKLIFIISLIFIFICWLPYLLNFFPGTLSPDSISEFTMISNGLKSVSDHHPIAHVLFVALFYNIGNLFTNNINIAISFATIAQMLIMSAILAYTIVFLKARGVNKWILLGLLCIYAFLPVNGYYSIVMWKDVLFAGSLVLFTMETIKIIEKDRKGKLAKKDYVPFVLSSLFCIFFRNNAIYMYIIFTVCGFFLLLHNKKSITITSVILILSFFIIKGPVFSLLNVTKSASSKYIAIPLQQVARIVYRDAKLTKEEEKLINDLIPIETIKKDYNPSVVDSIKFNKDYNREVFDNNKLEYFKLWVRLMIKHPIISIESYFLSTIGYYYPGVESWATADNVYENEYGIKQTILLPEKVSNLIYNFNSRKFPILAMEWSVGLYFWVLLIAVCITVSKHGIKYIYPFIPSIGIWITMMIASPVWGEFRYVYCVFLSMPLLLLFPYYINGKKDKYEKK